MTKDRGIRLSRRDTSLDVLEHNEMDSPSASLFRDVPEELISIITQRSLELERAPFTAEEMEHVLFRRRTMAVLYANNSACNVEHYHTNMSDASLWIDGALSGGCYNGNVYYYRQKETEFDADADEFVARMTGRFDADSAIISDFSLVCHPSDNEEEELFADVLLLDVRSVFLVLKRRLQLLNRSAPVEMAREQTTRYLQSIMSHYKGNLAVLEMYLDACGTELEIEADHLQIEDGVYNEEMIARMSQRCGEWYTLISNVIHHML